MTKLENVENSDQIALLHSLVETAYNNLWLVKQRLNTLPDFKNFKPPGVRNVRNHLITHTEYKNSGANIFSFGVITGGPVLRPIKPTGAKAPNDLGFIKNVHEFLTVLIRLNSA
jgi:hypothetical protein